MDIQEFDFEPKPRSKKKSSMAKENDAKVQDEAVVSAKPVDEAKVQQHVPAKKGAGGSYQRVGSSTVIGV